MLFELPFIALVVINFLYSFLGVLLTFQAVVKKTKTKNRTELELELELEYVWLNILVKEGT